MAEAVYRRLPGKRRTPVSATTLYLGPDHILHVRSTRIAEEYQRFYYQDVQAITIAKTTPFHYGWAVVFLLLGLAPRNLYWFIGSLVAGGIYLSARGPGAKVRLQTAVGIETLRSLHRLKTAQRVVLMMREQIELAQGAVIEIPEAEPVEWPVAAAPAVKISPPPLPNVSPGAKRFDHITLFGFLLFEAGLVGLLLVTRAAWVERVIAVAALIEFLAIVVVLVRQAQALVDIRLRQMTFLAAARWFMVQISLTLLAYKAVLIDGASKSIDPLTIGGGLRPLFVLLSLLIISVPGLWFALRRAHE
jgi:hypothetical protein